jgi:hypothetical protein
MTEEVKAPSASEQKKEDWMNSKWRPMMGWMYMLVCTMDMVVFPILWSLLQTTTGTAITQWNPLTLQGAGLFHIAMGAVLGIAAFGRTQEKLGGANNGGIQTSTAGFASGPSTYSQPQPGGFGSSGGFNSPAPSSFGSSSGFGAPTAGPVNTGSSWGTTPIASSGFGDTSAGITSGFGGKKAPPDAPQPLI